MKTEGSLTCPEELATGLFSESYESRAHPHTHTHTHTQFI